MARHELLRLLGSLLVLSCMSSIAHGAISQQTLSKIAKANSKGPYVGVATTSVSKLNLLMESGKFVPDADNPSIDVLGKRFRFGELEGLKVILFVLGHTYRAGETAELLLVLFDVKGVVVFGSAGNADPSFQIGDVTFPHYWAHTGVWNWEKFQNPNAPKLEVEGGVGNNKTNYAMLKIYKYNNPTSVNGKPVLNYLSKISYQAEELFPEESETTPDVQKKIFWIPISKEYFRLAFQLENLELEQCVDETNCLPRKPAAARARRGSSSSITVNNEAYRDFLYSSFDVTPIDTSSAAVALVCRQQRTPFIAFRALSNAADGSNESAPYSPLVTKNLVTVVLKFISLLASPVQTF